MHHHAIQVVGLAMGIATLSSALPAQHQLNSRSIIERQVPNPPPPTQLTDVDILQFALTAENLETAFYTQGFAKFKDADFAAAGLSPTDILNLKSVGTTEAVHVTTLSAAISASGQAPVQPCNYQFNFTTAQAMLQTAAVLENIGVSAYLGAAPLITAPSTLRAASQIVTVESRHQTFIRTASKSAAIPSAFDTPLGVRSVLTLASPFIVNCPKGSNINVMPFPSITMAPGAMSNMVSTGAMLKVSGGAGSTACAFTNGGINSGGSAFVDLVNGMCTVPMGLAGIAYLSLTNAKPMDNVLTDAITTAGPMVLIAS